MTEPKPSAGSSSSGGSSSSSSAAAGADSGFECNICFDPAQDPVVTTCGHLFCWRCLYLWFQQQPNHQCPVCKAKIEKENVIPVYSRGGSRSDHAFHRADDVPDADEPEVPARPHAAPHASSSSSSSDSVRGHRWRPFRHGRVDSNQTNFHGFGPFLQGYGGFVGFGPFGFSFGAGAGGLGGGSEQMTPGAASRPLSREEEAQQKLAHILFVIGLFILMSVLFY